MSMLRIVFCRMYDDADGVISEVGATRKGASENESRLTRNLSA